MTARNLARTAAAIEAYDRVDVEVTALLEGDDLTNAGVLEAVAKLEAAGEAVGVAFGEDTSDINSMETCRACVRPGPAVPSAGAEQSFVRRLAEEWRQQPA